MADILTMYEFWEEFINNNNLSSKIDPFVSRSWNRCLHKKIKYDRVPDGLILTQNELNERLERNELLIRASRPVVLRIKRFLKKVNYALFLCDPEGYVLTTFCNNSFSNLVNKVHLAPGANWSEERRGTNAIGTALIECAPLRVLGAEHFIRENHVISCWASPIKNRKGDIIGILDISGKFSGKRNPIIESHRISEMVLLGAANISNNFYLLKLHENFRHCSKALQVISKLLDQQHIIIDNEGYISDCTDAAIKPLSLKKSDLPGKHLMEILASASSDFSIAIPDTFSIKKQTSKSFIASFHSLIKNLEIVATQLNLSPNLLPEKSTNSGAWIGSCALSQKVLKLASKAALSNFPIILQGASGTGKELIARHIHDHSFRRNGPFIALNCAALPPNLIESELFGYVEGSFTGAKRGGKPGKFELANQGTIFLDEIGDMPLDAQVAILRVLQEKEVSRIGDTKTIKINVRIVAATHQNLQELIQKKLFRQDLYYRLGVIVIQLPDLSERKEDIRELVHYFTHRACSDMGKPTMEVNEDIFPYLYGHDWPGNVRELENCVANMVAMTEGERLTVSDLPIAIKAKQGKPKSFDENNQLLMQFKKNAIIEALKKSKGKIAPAARILGISRTSLYRKMRELKIDPHQVK